MTRWEYRIVNLSETSHRGRDNDVLAEAGNDGWELVAVTPNNIAYLKRPSDPPPPAAPPVPVTRARKASSRVSANSATSGE